MSGEKSVDALQTIRRASEIIDFVSSLDGRGARLTDVSAQTGLGKSTAHRLLTALTQIGLLDQDPESRAYYVGYKVVGMGEVAANRFRLADLADPAMQRLADATEETVYLSARSGNSAVCLARVTGVFPIKILTLAVGDSRPMGMGSGSIAILAHLPREEMMAVVRDNARLAPDDPFLKADALLPILERTRDRGYARTDGRVVTGISALAVPVLGGSGVPIAAMSVAAIAPRLEGERAERTLELLRREATELASKVEATLGPLRTRSVRHLASPR